MKLKKLISFVIFIVTLSLFVSCEKDDDFINVTDVSTNITSVVMVEGETIVLNAMVLPSNASNKNLNWSSSNENIVTVDNSGLVNSINVGEAFITITSEDGNKSVIIKVKVIESWISLSQNVVESSLSGGSYEIKVSASSDWRDRKSVV